MRDLTKETTALAAAAQADFVKAVTSDLNELSGTKAIAWGDVRPTCSSLHSFEELYIKVVQQEEDSRHDDDGEKNIRNHAPRSENKLFAEWTAIG